MGPIRRSDWNLPKESQPTSATRRAGNLWPARRTRWLPRWTSHWIIRRCDRLPRLAIAWCWRGNGVPQAAQITASVVRGLIAAGIAPDGITILRSQAGVSNGAEHPCRLVEKPLDRQIPTVVHDPCDRAGLAYLAADDNGEPIMLNRLLTDADVVLPIGCMQGAGSGGYFGIHTPLFPAFSDQTAVARFRRLDALGSNGPCKRDLRAR